REFRHLFGVVRLLALMVDAVCCDVALERAPPIVAATHDEQAVAGLEAVLVALVDEDDLVLPVEAVRVDARDDRGFELGLVANGRHDLELSADRTDARAALDHVERLGDLSAGGSRLRVPTIDADAAFDLYETSAGD